MSRILKYRNQLFRDAHKIGHIIYYYSVYQDIYLKMKNEGSVTEFRKGVPTNDEFIETVTKYKDGKSFIIVIDDFLGELSNELLKITAVSSRHHNATTILLHQTMFSKNPILRQISLNMSFIFVMKSPRAPTNFSYLAKQILPDGFRWLSEAYRECTSRPYSYFLFDLTQEQQDMLRFRGRIVPDEWPVCVYVDPQSST